MSRKSVLAAALGLAASLVATAASAATTFVLNFDDLSGIGPMPNAYGGVIFGDDFRHYDTPVAGFPPSSGLTTIYPNYDKYTAGVDATLTFRFTELVRFDGAFFSGKTPVAYDFYRGGVKVGSTAAFTAQSDQALFYATKFSGPVDEVRISGNSGNWVLDDLTYTTGVTAAVPEPGTWALMILGFGGAGAALRARRRSVFA